MYRMITGVVMLSAQEWECVKQLRASAVKLTHEIENFDGGATAGYNAAKVSIERTAFVERMES